MRTGGRSMLADLVIGWREKWAEWAREREQREREALGRRFDRKARRSAGWEWCLRKQLLTRTKQLDGEFKTKLEGDYFLKTETGLRKGAAEWRQSADSQCCHCWPRLSWRITTYTGPRPGGGNGGNGGRAGGRLLLWDQGQAWLGSRPAAARCRLHTAVAAG